MILTNAEKLDEKLIKIQLKSRKIRTILKYIHFRLSIHLHFYKQPVYKQPVPDGNLLSKFQGSNLFH